MHWCIFGDSALQCTSINDLKNFIYFCGFSDKLRASERESAPKHRLTGKLTVLKKEMKDHLQFEDTLNKKEVKGSAAENKKCLYFCTGYFAQPNHLKIFSVNFFVIFLIPSLT